MQPSVSQIYQFVYSKLIDYDIDQSYTEYIMWMMSEQYVDALYKEGKSDWFLAWRLKDLWYQSGSLWLIPLTEDYVNYLIAKPMFDCQVSLLDNRSSHTSIFR